jgi:hypothetical protein
MIESTVSFPWTGPFPWTVLSIFPNTISSRPGTSAVTATQSFSSCVCTTSFSLLPSSSAIYPCVHSLDRCWDQKHPSISYYTVFLFDPVQARKLRPNPCHRAFVLHPSACCPRLLSIYPYVDPPGRCWDRRHPSISYYTVFSFDPVQARKLWPNPFYRAFVPHLSACCLRLLSIYPYVHSPGRCWDPRHTISYDTAVSFDSVPARELQPNWSCNPCRTSSWRY